MSKETLDLLFSENTADQKKNQSYKDNFKEYELPDKYFLLEMYNKQKELQSFLAERGKTEKFPDNFRQVVQPNVQLAVYHLFCMQVELQELKVEIDKLSLMPTSPCGEFTESQMIDTRYELIDMFFFMFNVGIYSGLDMMRVVNELETFTKGCNECKSSISDISYLRTSVEHLINYIDKLPWKAWKEYDYQNLKTDENELAQIFALALRDILAYAKGSLGETDKSLFNLYMNKWEENRRRQLDATSGYVLPSGETVREYLADSSNK